MKSLKYILFFLLLNNYLFVSSKGNSDEVLSIMKKVADWQINELPYIIHEPLSWTNGPFYLGVIKLNEISNDVKYSGFLLNIGNSNKWNLNDRENKYHADDFCVAQMYIEMYKKYGRKEFIQPTISKVDYTINNPSLAPLWVGGEKGQERWSWCDALFMAPPVYAGLYSITGNDDYIKFMDREFKVCVDSLYDDLEHLFYRDRNYKGKLEPNGEKVFWGRGNGWSFAGIVSLLNFLPKCHETYYYYVNIFRNMADRILECQNPNGYWHASMLDPDSYPDQENSATGLFTYGLAWGLNNGLLDKSVYEIPVMKAWNSMVKCVSDEGKLGFVQQVGQRPEKIDNESTEIFGVGAMLMAGSEIYKLMMPKSQNEELKDLAKMNGYLANEGFLRSNRYLHDWLTYADPKTGLIPRNLHESIDLWNTRDAAADNYPYMVLTSSMIDKDIFEGRMIDILKAETVLTSRLCNIPDDYSFSKENFANDVPNIDEIIFGAAEYIKDGLIVITEWLGSSPWSNRMIDIMDDIWKIAPYKTKYGNIVSFDNEVNGDMLQALSRIYWLTGNSKYLEYAIRLGDFYLLGNHHPTRDLDRLRLRDHGCEIVSGLTELYATVHYANPHKKEEYKKPIYEMLDRILEVGRNEDGLFYDEINPITGEIIEDRIADNFSYIFNGFYTVYELDGIERYRDIVIQALETLNEKYKNYDWENLGVDGYADAVEGGINLYNREPITSLKEWIDSQIQVMWSFQDNHPGPRGVGWENSGIIEGMHPDGNFARTSLMYSLFKTQGLTIEPWRSDVIFGSVEKEDQLLIYISAGSPWKGKLIFDNERHSIGMHLPYDWPRINQFPEWYLVKNDEKYELFNTKNKIKTKLSGSELKDGIELTLEEGEQYYLQIKKRNKL